jgi:hypothetical protein
MTTGPRARRDLAPVGGGLAGEAHEPRAVVVRSRKFLARDACERRRALVAVGGVEKDVLEFVRACGDIAGAHERARLGREVLWRAGLRAEPEQLARELAPHVVRVLAVRVVLGLDAVLRELQRVLVEVVRGEVRLAHVQAHKARAVDLDHAALR